MVYNSLEYIKKIKISNWSTGSILSSLLKKDTRTVIFVGRLSSEKRPELALTAFKLVSSRAPSVVMLFIGEGSLRMKLEQTVNKLKLEGKVFFFGRVTKKDAVSIISKADILISTSISEGFANVVAEAMATDCAVVAYKNDCLAEMGGGGSVMLIDSSDPRAFAQAIINVLTDHQLRQRLIFNAKNRMLPFKEISMTERLELIYEYSFTPKRVAQAVEKLLIDPSLAEKMSNAAAEGVKEYSWGQIAKAYEKIYRHAIKVTKN